MKGGKAGGAAQVHHVFPQELAKEFKDIGIKNVHDPQFGAWVDATHQSWGRRYQDEWEAFFNGSPSFEAAMQKARQLAADLGFAINF